MHDRHIPGLSDPLDVIPGLPALFAPHMEDTHHIPFNISLFRSILCSDAKQGLALR
jgi:hypothetical protein